MGDTALRRAPAIAATDWLRPLPPAARFAFCGDAAAQAAAAAAWGPEFSQEPCRAKVRGTRASLWLGPDEYLLLEMAAGTAGADAAGATGAALVAGAAGLAGAAGAVSRAGSTAGIIRPADQTAAAFSELERALAPLPHALVDISHRQFAVEVSGPRAATILNGACPLDLDLREFPVGMCTRTVFAKADIVLWRTHANSFHVEIWRSFAGYVTGVLREIAGEFYPERNHL
jgi:sarcosine oxidase subunit gamma